METTAAAHCKRHLMRHGRPGAGRGTAYNLQVQHRRSESCYDQTCTFLPAAATHGGDIERTFPLKCADGPWGDGHMGAAIARRQSRRRCSGGFERRCHSQLHPWHTCADIIAKLPSRRTHHCARQSGSARDCTHAETCTPQPLASYRIAVHASTFSPRRNAAVGAACQAHMRASSRRRAGRAGESL